MNKPLQYRLVLLLQLAPGLWAVGRRRGHNEEKQVVSWLAWQQT